MIVYRIADCKYINDLSGTGAALYGARWNNKNTYMVYTAQSPSLALLEAIVHMGKLPDNGFCLISIEIPDSVAPKIVQENLPANWHANPAPDVLKRTGDNFIKSGRFLALPVPSVIMSDECNYLLNPAHPLFSKVKIIAQKPVRLDGRILPLAKA